ncbi:helix-turn-helix domain-containing protein [Ferruginibacter sp.]
MHFNFSFYSAILLIFFSQGIIFSFLLLKKSIISLSRPSKWLSFFIFLCAIYLLPWMLGFAGWYSLQPYRDIMFYIPFQQLFLIGPAIYFYTQSLLNPSFKFKRKDWLHLVPAILYITYRLVIFATDKIILQQYYFYANGKDKNLDTWYQIAGFISMLIYFLLSLRYYTIYKKIILQTLSFADTLLFNWIKKYLVAFLLMQFLWLIFFLFYPGWGNFKEKWWYYISFSFLMYYVGITGYTNNIKSLIPFRISGIQNKPVYLLENTNDEIELTDSIEIELKEQSAETINPHIEEWKTKITNAIEAEDLYKNPALTLVAIATVLKTNQTVISKMINQGFKMNFNDFINNYRIEAVKQLLQNGEHKKQTLLGISIDCGFNSKTTFNRCFKKNTGMSPKEFIENLQNIS